jgi:hypothetical protein
MCTGKIGRKPHPNSLFDLKKEIYIYIYIVKAQAGKNVV